MSFKNGYCLLAIVLFTWSLKGQEKTLLHSTHSLKVGLGIGTTGYAGNLGIQPISTSSFHYYTEGHFLFLPQKRQHGILLKYENGIWGTDADKDKPFQRDFQTFQIGYCYLFRKLPVWSKQKIIPYIKVTEGIILFKEIPNNDFFTAVDLGIELIISPYVSFFAEASTKYLYAGTNDYSTIASALAGDFLTALSVGVHIELLPPISRQKYSTSSTNCTRRIGRKKRKRFFFTY